MARVEHDHELDGVLHDGCPMCELIRQRWAEAKARDKPADALAERYARIAERGKSVRTVRYREDDT